MRGSILIPASETTPGEINGVDGNRYRYGLSDVRGAAGGGSAVVIFSIEGQDAREVEVEPDERSVLESDGRDWLAFFANPRGRVARKDFWVYGIIPLTLVRLVITKLPEIAAIPLLILSSWALLTLSFKRCHDVGRSGWWSLLPWFAFALFLFVPSFGAQERSTAEYVAIAMFAIAAVLAYLWMLFGILAQPGETGANRFGSDPKTP